MAECRLSLRAVLDRLVADGLIAEADVDSVGHRLQDRPPSDPVYITLPVGAGAWLAAVFLFLYVTHALGMDDHPQVMIVLGLASVLVAVLIDRMGWGTFLRQFALALGFAGHLLVLFGVARPYRSGSCAALTMTQVALCAVVYPFYRSRIYRFLMPLAAFALSWTWILDGRNEPLLQVPAIVGLYAGAVLSLAARRRRALAPLAYALVTGGLASVLVASTTKYGWWGHTAPLLWPSTVLTALLLVGLSVRFAGGLACARHEWFWVVVGATAVLGAVSTPGLVAALAVLALGHGLADRALTGLGLAFLPAFLVLYYYDLDVSLAHKSWILAGSGVVLLVGRWVLGRRPWAGRALP